MTALWLLLIVIAFLAGMSSPKQLNFSMTDRKPAKRGRPAKSTTPRKKKESSQPDLPLTPP